MSVFDYRAQPGYLRRLGEALQVTQQELSDQIGHVLGAAASPIQEDQIEDLEAVLIGSDIGVETTLSIVEKVRSATLKERSVTQARVRRILRAELLAILKGCRLPPPSNVKPQVILVVGVNGVGKTTTIGKLAAFYRNQGSEVLICACDTFRAAAVEQLAIWSRRSGAEIIKQSAGADPAAVLFDALRAAEARKVDYLLADTAGRLHTKTDLMQELKKMKRIASREVEGAPHEVFLVVDATTGQNGLIQAREFLAAVGVSGLIVTKLDGTAKGGIVVAIARDLGIPIRFVGVGEQLGDLMPFSAEAFVASLLSVSEENMS